jgi:NDP-sugar pyrophosphorylase family protein
MQCVILAAGRGSRMQPLTNETPKPLIKVCGKSLLQHIFEALPPEIDEIILVVNYLEEQIRLYCGEEFLGRKVQYVTQANPVGGTGDALMRVKDLIRGRFLFMYADDIHGAEALKKVVSYPYAMLAGVSDNPELFGVLEMHEDGTLKAIHEKPKEPMSNLINIGGVILDADIFNYQTSPSVGGEVLATDMITEFAKTHPVMVVKQDLWIPVGKPEDIEKAETVLCSTNN